MSALPLILKILDKEAAKPTPMNTMIAHNKPIITFLDFLSELILTPPLIIILWKTSFFQTPCTIHNNTIFHTKLQYF